MSLTGAGLLLLGCGKEGERPTVTVPGEVKKDKEFVPHGVEVVLFPPNKLKGSSEHRIELWGEPYTRYFPCGWNNQPSCFVDKMWPGERYWRVQERKNGIEGDWSEPWSFIVGPDITLVTSELSNNTFAPGDRIEGKFTVRNNGSYVWRTNRIGIGVEGPSYLDFGWKENVDIAPGESYTFEGAVPNAPDVRGVYSANPTRQDKLDYEPTWRRLAKESTKFTIK